MPWEWEHEDLRAAPAASVFTYSGWRVSVRRQSRRVDTEDLRAAPGSLVCWPGATHVWQETEWERGLEDCELLQGPRCVLRVTGLWKETEWERGHGAPGRCSVVCSVYLLEWQVCGRRLSRRENGGLPSCSSVRGAYLLGVSGVQQETEWERKYGAPVSMLVFTHSDGFVVGGSVGARLWRTCELLQVWVLFKE